MWSHGIGLLKFVCLIYPYDHFPKCTATMLEVLYLLPFVIPATALWGMTIPIVLMCTLSIRKFKSLAWITWLGGGTAGLRIWRQCSFPFIGCCPNLALILPLASHRVLEGSVIRAKETSKNCVSSNRQIIGSNSPIVVIIHVPFSLWTLVRKDFPLEQCAELLLLAQICTSLLTWPVLI